MKDRKSSDSAYFDAARSSAYDKKIRASIPGYDALHAMTRDLMQAAIPQEAKILVAGAGTGMEIITLGSSNSKWTFTAVDTSDDMLSICKNNVDDAGMSRRVEVHRGHVDELPDKQSYDAATSILVSHFIKDRESRKAFFQAIADRLLPKGLLVTADITASISDPALEYFIKAWKTHYGNAGIPEKEVEEDFYRSMRTVSFVPETELCSILLENGFEDVRPFFRAFLFGGWFCFRK
ncbi:MAG: class I SAM-dependent methyltransferase [Nitrospirae bacterium]|nr:class I SAM-dependent methyltransferase [Nitrospirota bacterium]